MVFEFIPPFDSMATIPTLQMHLFSTPGYEAPELRFSHYSAKVNIRPSTPESSFVDRAHFVLTHALFHLMAAVTAS